MRGDAGEAGVDDRGDAVDGDGALCDVGGEDEFGLRGRGDGAVLLCRRKVAVEGQDEAVDTAGDGLASALGAADFSSTGRKARISPVSPPEMRRSKALRTCSSSGAGE